MSGKETVHQMDVQSLDIGTISKEISLDNLVEEIRNSLMGIKQNYLKIGWSLRYIRDTKSYEKEGFQNINEFAEHYFNLSQSAVSRFIRICEQFSVGDRPELKQEYASYNLSQLIELLPMDEDLRNQVTPEMTVTQLRELKKTLLKHDQGETVKGKADPYEPDADENNANSPCKYILDRVENELQTELPEFQDDDERMEWVDDVDSWGLWYIDPNTWAEYFKYDFCDGSRLIAVKFKDIFSSYVGQVNSNDIHYHMVFSSDFLEKHQDEFLAGYKNHSVFIATPVEAIIRFLDELQSGEPKSSAIEDSNEADEGYISNDNIMLDFDPDRSGAATSYGGKQYEKTYEKVGHIPKYTNLKHCADIKDCAQTLTTGSGSATGMGSIVPFDAEKEAEIAVNNENLDIRLATHNVNKILRVAEPEERKKVEKILNRGNTLLMENLSCS